MLKSKELVLKSKELVLKSRELVPVLLEVQIQGYAVEVQWTEVQWTEAQWMEAQWAEEYGLAAQGRFEGENQVVRQLPHSISLSALR